MNSCMRPIVDPVVEKNGLLTTTSLTTSLPPRPSPSCYQYRAEPISGHGNHGNNIWVIQKNTPNRQPKMMSASAMGHWWLLENSLVLILPFELHTVATKRCKETQRATNLGNMEHTKPMLVAARVPIVATVAIDMFLTLTHEMMIIW